MTYYTKLNEDLKFGLESEENNFEKFKDFLNCPELKKTARNHPFDFESDNHLVELKTRKCLSTTYKDTMMPVSKLNYCKDKGKDVYFCFQFTDGLYYWKHNDDEEKKCRFGRGGRFDRSRAEVKDYFFIPTDLLIPV